ncbi:MAG TPA: mechanosensitive ion channel domain-containing protein [Chloroflexia bacterium]|nr:mechanosensitive ion channel domain-containing protein [Chloroflexia bacterium]
MFPGFSQQDVITVLFNLARAAAILIVGLVVARAVRAWVLRLGLTRRIAVNLAALLGNLAQVLISAFALILILPTFGVDWTGVLTLVGTVGLAVSLAFQDVLKNVIAGVYLLIERPFQIGDVITIERGAPITGTVQSIELRISTLRTAEGVQVIVPNNTIFTEVVTNRSAFNLQRKLVSVAIALADESMSSLTGKITEVLGGLPNVSKSPAPSTHVEQISPASLKLHVEFWTAPAVEARATEEAVLALREALPNAEVVVIG